MMKLTHKLHLSVIFPLRFEATSAFLTGLKHEQCHSHCYMAVKEKKTTYCHRTIKFLQDDPLWL